MALAVEQAKLLWATGRQHRATVEIQEALDDAADDGGGLGGLFGDEDE